MNIKETITKRRQKDDQIAKEEAQKALDTIFQRLEIVVSSDAILFAGYILIQISRENLFQIELADKNLIIHDSPVHPAYTFGFLLEDDDFFNATMSNQSDFCKKRYIDYITSALKTFMNDEGFVNLGEILPTNNGDPRNADEIYEWYALEL